MKAAQAPIELLLVSFPHKRFRGEILSELEKLVKQQVIRIIDILLVTKDKSGNVAVSEISELEPDDYQMFDSIVSETKGLLSEKDAHSLSSEMPNDSAAGVMLFEDTWAGELSKAIDRAGGEVVVNERIPQRALEALSE